MFMNHVDIDEALALCERHHPAIAPYARYLRDWRDIVDRNSDGWHSWPGGSRAARGLCALLQQAVNATRRRGVYPPIEVPDASLFARTLGPIKACATRRGLPLPTLAR
jgi:hypothetical protein